MASVLAKVLIALSKGDYDEALVNCNQAVELDPKYATAYGWRGTVYSGKGNLDQAIADYSKAIELNPGYAYAYNHRGRLYREKGLKPQAIADFEKYLQLDPNASDRAQVEQWLRELKGQ